MMCSAMISLWGLQNQRLNTNETDKKCTEATDFLLLVLKNQMAMVWRGPYGRILVTEFFGNWTPTLHDCPYSLMDEVAK